MEGSVFGLRHSETGLFVVNCMYSETKAEFITRMQNTHVPI